MKIYHILSVFIAFTLSYACTAPNELALDEGISIEVDMKKPVQPDQQMNMFTIDDQFVAPDLSRPDPDLSIIDSQIVDQQLIDQLIIDQADMNSVDQMIVDMTVVDQMVIDSEIIICTNDMAIVYGDWSECEYPSPCAQVGSQSRNAQSCVDGDFFNTTETQECTRDTTDAIVFSMWTECAYTDSCIETGERVRNYTMCQNGEAVDLSITQACTRETDDTIVNSMWTECGNFESTCDNSGTRTRNYTMCVDGVALPYTFEAACTRNTNETVIDGNETLGECGNYSSACDQTGTQTKSFYVCMNEQPELRTTEVECTRNTQDVILDDTIAWGACVGFDSTCDQTGTQYRTLSVCQNGEIISQEVSQPCTRDTNGVIADEGIWSECGSFDSTCDTTGTRSKTYQQCLDGNPVPYQASEDCTRDTNGVVVDASAPWTECSGFTSTCDQIGTHEKTFIICSNGIEVPDLRSGECTRDTNGILVNPGVWSDCGSFDSICDTTGTRSKTYTQCNNGIAVDYPTSEACTRVTDGIIVNAGVWSDCGGFTSTCDSSGTRSKTSTQCSNGIAVDYPTSEACSRVTNGVSCGTNRVCQADYCY